MNDIEEKIETTDDIQKAIDELQAKLVKTEAKENEEAVEKVKIPIATCVLKIDKGGSNVPLRNVTPAEVMLLVAEHHRRAGGMPVSSVKLTGEINVDPRILRLQLSNKYGAKKVNALYPGVNPQFPKTFRSAMFDGVKAELPESKLMEFKVFEHAGE